MTMSIEQQKRSLAQSLWVQGAIKIGEFKLKLHEKFPDAPRSPIFLNLRTPGNPKPGTLSDDDVMNAAKLMRMYAQNVCSVDFEYVIGIPNAGTPFAEFISRLTDVQLLRLAKETNGDKRCIGGLIESSVLKSNGKGVLVVDDLITHAESKVEAFGSIRNAGLDVAALVVLVDREQGGAEEVRKAGVQFISVFKLSELLDLYVEGGYLSAQARSDVAVGLDAIDRYVAEHEAS